jgi:hypothetical protein
MHSAWTYAAAPGTGGTAAGQLPWSALSRFAAPRSGPHGERHGEPHGEQSRGQNRGQNGGQNRDPGLLVLLGGDAVAASPGPAVYTPLAAEQGFPLLDLPAPTADPVAAVALLETLGLRGASVTMPHKAALSAVATPRGFAARVGAINTLSPKPPPPD